MDLARFILCQDQPFTVKARQTFHRSCIHDSDLQVEDPRPLPGYFHEVPNMTFDTGTGERLPIQTLTLPVVSAAGL